MVSATLEELWVHKEGVGVGHGEFAEKNLPAGSLGVGRVAAWMT